MMKKLLFLGAAGIILLSACKGGSEGSYTISGEIKGLKDSVLYLAQQNNNLPHFDTLSVKDGKFKFSGTTSHPVMAQIITLDQSGGFPVFLETGNIHVSGVADSLAYGKIDVTGTPNNDDFHSFMEMQMPFIKETMGMQSDYMKANMAGDTAQMSAIQLHSESLQQQMLGAIKKFIGDHPKSLVSGIALQSMMESLASNELAQLYSGLDTAVQNSEFGKLVGARITSDQKTAIGSQAPDFTLNTPEGKEVSLASFRGKYVLVDFWASWCGPCRQENPNVVKAYNEYKDKNFTILGVSLDKTKEDWVQAIKADHLTWNHVSDLKYMQSPVADEYGIQGIPANFLIDPQGKIVAKNLRGESLENKLAEVLK